MNVLNDMLSITDDPRMLHAAVVHFPIVLAWSGLALLIVLVLRRGGNRTLRWAAVANYAALLAFAFLATQTGDAAEGRLGLISTAAEQTLHDHDELAEKLWLFALAALVGVGAGWLRKQPAALAGRIFALLSGLTAAGWVSVTAHHGGTLVYKHDVIPPPRATPAPAAPAARENDAAPAALAQSDVRITHFREQVWPLLLDNCVGCHQGDEPAANFRLTSMSEILRGGDSGPAIVPGRPDDSLLYRTVAWIHDAPKMPLESDQLSADKIAILSRWIMDGAAWEAVEFDEANELEGDQTPRNEP